MGKIYQNEDDIAKLRTGINRFYFSSFLKSRDYLLENNIFLGNASKKIMNSTSGKVHSETRNIFKKHPVLMLQKKVKR